MKEIILPNISNWKSHPNGYKTHEFPFKDEVERLTIGKTISKFISKRKNYKLLCFVGEENKYILIKHDKHKNIKP